MYELTQQEMDRLSDLALGHEQEWLDEYIDILKSNDLWDIHFIEYKCYKVFISEYKEDINLYREEFFRESGTNISFNEAGWGLYFIATKQEHRLGNEPAES
tara:strand:+ start:83 stop:385 length:303 start_codon:yes stop_codon:yes gene_type:complete